MENKERKLSNDYSQGKFKLWKFLIVAVCLISFLLYGLWPRVDVQLRTGNLGTKYKTTMELQRDIGKPHYGSKTIDEKGLTVYRYVYVDRFILPSGSLTVWCDENNRITAGVYRPQKKNLFLFPKNSPFFLLTLLEDTIRSAIIKKAKASKYNGTILQLQKKWNQ